MLVALILPLSGGHATAQEQALPLVADLFVLTDEGMVMRIEAGGTFATVVTPENQRVIDFGPAPDGRWVAYRLAADENTNSQPLLAVTSIDGQSGQVLEFETAGQPPITGRGQTLAWSPDGTAIAYTTAEGLRLYLAGMGEAGAPAFLTLQGGPFFNLLWSPGGGYLAAEAENNTWWVYQRSPSGMTYSGQIPGSAGLAWVREGVMALAPPSGGLIALEISTGSQTVLVDVDTLVSKPTRVSNDRLMFLVHEASGQQFAARRFGTVSTTGGDGEIIEAALDLTAAMRWLPDGVALTDSVDGTLTIIEPRTNTRRAIMDGVKAYVWGPLAPVEVPGMALPTDLYFLSRDTAGITQLWVLPADGSPARQLTLEPRSVLDYAISPDGTRVAYTSAGNLLVANLDGSGGEVLSPVVERPGAGAMPAWSPDGQLIAFVRDGIWVIPASGGARTELITDSFDENTAPQDIAIYMNPRWSPNGTMLLIDIGYYEGRGLALLPITGGQATPLPVAVSQGDWLPDGRVLAWDYGFAYTEPGLYVVNPADPANFITVLDSTWHVLDAMPLASEAVKILRATGGDVMGPSAVQPFLVPVLPDALPIAEGQGGLIEQPRLSPDGRFAAGLRDIQFNEFGQAGRLAIIDLTTGERYAIETPGELWGIQWGGMP
ncbi:MAG: hypothetical protein Kow0077_22050 [Anaerolineae bacterium]